MAYNKEPGIVPKTVKKSVSDILEGAYPGGMKGMKKVGKVADDLAEYSGLSPKEMGKKLEQLEQQMYQHARDLEFEEAAAVRDQIAALKKIM